MALVETGNSTPGNQNVDANYNAQTNLPYTTPAGVAQGGGQLSAGFATLLSERDSGSITGVRDVYAPEVTTNFRLRTATDQILFNEIFPGTVLNSSLWTTPATTSTITVGGNQLTLNAAASLASGSVARVSSYRSFPVLISCPIYLTANLQFSAIPVSNMVHEWGEFTATGTSVPTEGAYFTITATGELRAIVNTGGSINQSPILDYNALIGVNSTKSFLIYTSNENVTFWINNIKVFEAPLSSVSTLGVQIGSGQLPISFRSYNTATVTGTAQIMKVNGVNLSIGETAINKFYAHAQAGGGQVGYQGQTGGTLGTTALYTNNLTAGAGAAMTNTTAALGSGLGGQFSIQPTLVVGTDGIVCSYQVPLGTVSIPGKMFYITGVKLQGAVTTALTGGAVLYAYSLAYGHNSVSLTTTVSSTAKAPVRVFLGYESYIAAAPIATLGQGVVLDLNSAPVPVFPGEFIQIVAKNLGVVTTAGVITCGITLLGYYE